MKYRIFLSHLLLVLYLLVSSGLQGVVYLCDNEAVGFKLMAFHPTSEEGCLMSSCCTDTEDETCENKHSEDSSEEDCCDTAAFNLDYKADRYFISSYLLNYAPITQEFASLNFNISLVDNILCEKVAFQASDPDGQPPRYIRFQALMLYA